MGAVTDTASQVLEQEALAARIAKLVLEVDSLAIVLPKAFSKSRLNTIRVLAEGMPTRSQAMVLSLNMDRPAMEVRETVGELLSSIAQLRLMSSRTRVEQGALLTLLLIEKLAESLSADLAVWEREA